MSAPDDYSRMQHIMADNAVNAIIEASVNGVVTREAFEMTIRAALTANALYDAKHGGWRQRINFNSANDEELKR